MKKYTVFNVVGVSVCTVTAQGLKSYLRKYEKQARALLKKSQCAAVLYGVVHEGDGGQPSCHIIAPKPCTADWLKRNYPTRTARPLVVRK